MLKFATHDPPRLILGITDANVRELQAGHPLKIEAGDLQHLGLPAMELVVFTGPTQHALVDQLHDGGLLDHDQAASLHQATTDLEARHGKPS